MHERALAGPRRRRLREPLEVGEPERERALLERRAGARRQRPGGREAHRSEGTRGGVTATRIRGGDRRARDRRRPGCVRGPGSRTGPGTHEGRRDARRAASTAIGAQARQLEDVGYDGGVTAETGHDPFLPLVLAARAHRALELGTGDRGRVRPHADDAGDDRQRPAASRRRVGSSLGLGSQIKPHIERRFSMPWSHPARAHARVRARDARDLGGVERRREARLPRRVLHAHADDAVLQSRARTRTGRRRCSSRRSARR